MFCDEQKWKIQNEGRELPDRHSKLKHSLFNLATRDEIKDHLENHEKFDVFVKIARERRSEIDKGTRQLVETWDRKRRRGGGIHVTGYASSATNLGGEGMKFSDGY